MTRAGLCIELLAMFYQPTCVTSAVVRNVTPRMQLVKKIMRSTFSETENRNLLDEARS